MGAGVGRVFVVQEEELAARLSGNLEETWRGVATGCRASAEWESVGGGLEEKAGGMEAIRKQNQAPAWREDAAMSGKPRAPGRGLGSIDNSWA